MNFLFFTGNLLKRQNHFKLCPFVDIFFCLTNFFLCQFLNYTYEICENIPLDFFIFLLFSHYFFKYVNLFFILGNIFSHIFEYLI